MRLSRRGLIVFTAVLLAGGCADFGAPVGGDAAPLSSEETRIQALEGRIADLQRRVENLNLAAMAQDNARLESEVRSMRGEVERLVYVVDSSDKRGKELYVDLDKRLQVLENDKRSAKLKVDPSLASSPPVPASSSPEEESTYLQVFDQLKAGRYDDAIGGFRGMIERWPTGRYADNAWYWLGESQFVKKDFEAAQSSFDSLLKNFPASPKLPDALLKLGLTQIELKQPDAAKASLEQVIKDHPRSNAAALARQRLEQLK